MKKPLVPAFNTVSAILAAAIGAAVLPASHAADIPGLFNSGVDDNGNPLPASGAVDPHYTLTVSPDETFTGPDAVTLNPGFPVGPWLEATKDSKWITANQDQGNSAPGDYTFRTTFDLTGFDPGNAVITGRWSVDNSGVDIILNGESLGITNGGGFTSWSEFIIDSGFVDGENVLEFIVNNAGDAVNPAGFRVEMRGTVQVADEAPRLLKQPVSQNIFQGDPASFTVDADGTPPLSYQWFKGETPIGGANGAQLTIDAVTLEDGGDYKVVVTNGVGSATSETARLAVVQALTGLYNTGMNADGTPIEDYEVDPHFILVINPHEESPDAFVQDTQAWPIVAGPWLLPTETSKWIGPTPDTNAEPGNYHFRYTFDIAGFDPETVFVAGDWSSDNAALDILVNGASTGKNTGGNFGAWVPFLIEGGFVEGENTLEFVVNNAGDAANPAGLRIENFRGGAVAVNVPTQIVTQPRGGTVFASDDVTLSVVATGIPPIVYQWRRDGEPIEGATGETLRLPAIGVDQAGDYDVVVTAGQGETTSAVATLAVLTRIPVFATGVDDDRLPLEDFEIDPHWELAVNPDAESPDAMVLNHSAWPIDGTWVLGSATSKWIGVREDANGVPGEYTYRTTFDLSSFDPETVVIRGQWAVDDSGPDVLLNGESIGIQNTTGFGGYASFEVLEGFVAGVNTLEIVVSNGGEADNPTGLRLENVQAGGVQVDLSPFVITGVARDAAALTLTWNSRGGAIYAIDFSTDLQDWQELNDGVAGEGSSTSYIDADGARLAMEELYYRVRQIP